LLFTAVPDQPSLKPGGESFFKLMRGSAKSYHGRQVKSPLASRRGSKSPTEALETPLRAFLGQQKAFWAESTLEHFGTGMV
jgi:hypothetical protein